jgi:hypothetical protein
MGRLVTAAYDETESDRTYDVKEMVLSTYRLQKSAARYSEDLHLTGHHGFEAS